MTNKNVQNGLAYMNDKYLRQTPYSRVQIV